jgi:hypothetical protein
MVMTTLEGGPVDEAPVLDASSETESRSIGELIDAGGGGPSANFDFAHKVFSMPGARFCLDERTRGCFFYVKLGQLDVAIAPPVLKREFGIADDSEDARLIAIAEKGLLYVPEIKPGDSIPRELLDGSASWKVEERHTLIARTKLLTQVARFIDPGTKDLSILERLLAEGANEVTAKEEIQNAFAAIAESIGLGRNRKQEVIDRVEAFARELAYIEALRDHVKQVQLLQVKANELLRHFRRDQSFAEELMRVLNLLKRPVGEFNKIFLDVDAQAGELLALLRNTEQQTAFIRRTRDEVHRTLMLWREILELWNDPAGGKVSDPGSKAGEPPEKTVRALYRFLATHYAATVAWR